MLKIRLQGTIDDIKWFQKIVKGSKQVAHVEFSEPFATKYVCVYGEIERKNSK